MKLKIDVEQAPNGSWTGWLLAGGNGVAGPSMGHPTKKAAKKEMKKLRKCIRRRDKISSKVFPDTADGAIDCAKAIMGDAIGEVMAVVCDPWVHGVWKLVLGGSHCQEVIVFLAGYPDVWGETREINDVEGEW